MIDIKDSALLQAYHKLTAKQKAFIECYPQADNATDAARKAGYFGKGITVTASRLLAHPTIKALVPALEKSAADKIKKTAELYEINKENLLLINWNLIKSDKTKPSDKINASSLIAKILGIYRDNQPASVSIFQNIAGEIEREEAEPSGTIEVIDKVTSDDVV